MQIRLLSIEGNGWDYHLYVSHDQLQGFCFGMLVWVFFSCSKMVWKAVKAEPKKRIKEC